MSKKPQISKLKIGMAGEYLVAAKMSLDGWTANLTYKNYPGVDIIGQHPRLDENSIVRIQVKSSVEPSFWVGIKYSQRGQMNTLIKGPYVFVYFEEKEGHVHPSFYILSKAQVINVINQSDEDYRSKSRSKKLASDYSIKVYIMRDRLCEYQDKWDNLFE